MNECFPCEVNYSGTSPASGLFSVQYTFIVVFNFFFCFGSSDFYSNVVTSL